MSTSSPAALWGCAKHALMGSTCCQDTDVMVTEGDKVRITAWLGPDLEPFWEDGWPRRPAAVDDGSDPTWALAFHMDGSRPILRHRPNGDCLFLGPTGCVLPTKTRPLVCRLYPREFDEGGFLGLDDGCPAEVIPEGQSITDLIDMDPDRAERWRRQLYTEILESPRR